MLLAFDTATATASVAVYDPDTHTLLAELTWEARRRHTQDLLAAAQDLLQRCDRTPSQLTALATTLGPGSFTGVRIALSALKGMALGLPQATRVVGLPTLSVTAAPWLAAAGAAQAVVCAYIQAGRGRYNWAYFAAHDLLSRPGPAEHRAGTAAHFAADLEAAGQRAIWLVGEPAPDLLEAVAALAQVTAIDAVSGWRRAGHLARLAALHLAQGYREDPAALQPVYLQEP